jgi:hypothetical protein
VFDPTPRTAYFWKLSAPFFQTTGLKRCNIVMSSKKNIIYYYYISRRIRVNDFVGLLKIIDISEG